MNEIVKEDDMKNMYQNKGNNGNRNLDDEVLESTKLSNQIIVLVANTLKSLKPESGAFLQPLYERIIIFIILINL
jgi:hypothetical protein